MVQWSIAAAAIAAAVHECSVPAAVVRQRGSLVISLGEPSRDGRWRAPNVARARALVAASGTRGERVTVSAFNDDSDFH
jgi:hypothetical protein